MILRRLSMWFRRQRITIQAAIIGAVAVLAAALITGFFGLLQPFATGISQRLFDTSDLELVDVSFSEESNEATTLDIKVRNTGEKVAYLKEADFRVERTWELRSLHFPIWVPVSQNYDVTLSPSDTPYTRTVKLSQAIEPNEVDRFTFTLALNNLA